MASEIPPILHQTWRTAELPRPYDGYRRRWIELHPHWEHRFYDDAAIERTFRERAPEWRATYDALPRMIQRIDFFRYLIVHLDGGLYADIDVLPYQSLDPLLRGTSCVLGVETHFREAWRQAYGFPYPWQLANFIFAAAPGHPFMAALVEEVGRTARNPANVDAEVEDTTGPRMLTRLIGRLSAEQRGPVKILPQVNWNPPRPYRRIGPLKDRIYVRHNCAGTWRNAPWSPKRLYRAAGCRMPDPFATTGPQLPG